MTRCAGTWYTLGPDDLFVDYLVRPMLQELGKKIISATVFSGEIVIAAIHAITHGKSFRTSDFVDLLAFCSAKALPITIVVNVLVGCILAFVGAVQLVKFGAGIYVADLVSIAESREMAATITAVIMCGRTGASFAAELSTMQVNEEIDALEVLGLSPIDYLVLPRILALILTLPLLYLFACAAGIFGGFLVGADTLNMAPQEFFDRLIRSLKFTDLALGFCKSFVFGGLVAWAGCFYGLTAQRSAAGVGEATTNAVVSGMVAVIAMDAIFAVCANALGI